MVTELLSYLRFHRAFRKCDKLNRNRQRNRYIVINLNGKPIVINRSAFRILQRARFFRQDKKWNELFNMRVYPK